MVLKSSAGHNRVSYIVQSLLLADTTDWLDEVDLFAAIAA